MRVTSLSPSSMAAVRRGAMMKSINQLIVDNSKIEIEEAVCYAEE